MSPAARSPVRLALAPEPGHVRVVRLVTVSLARLSGLNEEVLDDVRLATSEAVGRAVATHRFNGVRDMVEVEVDVSRGLRVRVRDRVALPAATGQEAVELVQRAVEEMGGDDTTDAVGPVAVQDGIDTLDLNVRALAAAAAPLLPEGASLIGSLADESSVATGPDGTVVTMRWQRPG